MFTNEWGTAPMNEASRTSRRPSRQLPIRERLFDSKAYGWDEMGYHKEGIGIREALELTPEKDLFLPPRAPRRLSKIPSDASNGFYNRFRRASMGMKTAFCHVPTHCFSPDDPEQDAVEQPQRLVPFPNSSKPAFGGRWLRRFSKSRSEQLSTEALLERDWSTEKNFDGASFQSFVVPGHGSEPPILSGNPYQGQAARAAAAAQNGRLHNYNNVLQLPAFNRNDSFESCLSADWIIPPINTRLRRDTESGIHLVDRRSQCTLLEHKRIDPTLRLPLDVAEMVFSNLDAPTLATALRVCRRWYSVAMSNAVWREVFLRRYREPQSETASFVNGGTGLGPKSQLGNNWRRMYHTRKHLDHHWKRGQVMTVYFTGHTDSVYCHQFDENKLITGSRDRTLRVWDLHTYECVKIIGPPSYNSSTDSWKLHCLRKHSSAIMDKQCIPADSSESIFHTPHDYHAASILCLQFDEQIMVTGSSDTTCLVWDVNTFEPIRRLYGHTQGVLDLCFDKKYIVSCSKDSTIRVWDRFSGECLKVFSGHTGPVNAIQLRGNFLVSASGDGVCKLWNIADGTCTKEFRSNDRGLACVEFSDDGKYVFAGGNDHIVWKFDANTGVLLDSLEGHKGLVRSLHFDGANKRLITGSYDQSLKVFDYETKEMIANFPEWTTSWMLSAKSDYRRIIATSQDGRAVLLDFGISITGIEALEDRRRPTVQQP